MRPGIESGSEFRKMSFDEEKAILEHASGLSERQDLSHAEFAKLRLDNMRQEIPEEKRKVIELRSQFVLGSGLRKVHYDLSDGTIFTERRKRRTSPDEPAEVERITLSTAEYPQIWKNSARQISHQLEKIRNNP